MLTRKIKSLRLVERDQFEAHGLPRHHLCETREIDARDLRDFRITASRLTVCHQNNGIAVGRYLDGSERDALRDHFDCLARCKFSALKPISHPVGTRRDGEL